MEKRHSPSFPWKEVPRRGGGWNRRGMKGNMRKAVSHIVYRHPERSRGIFAIRGQGVTLPPHMCRALLRFTHLSFMPLEPYPARYARHLPHGGRLTILDILFFHLFSCPPWVLLLLAIPQSRFPVCKEDFSLRSK